LIGTGSRLYLFWGYAAGGIFMIAAAIVEGFIGVSAERQSLESIAKPLSAECSSSFRGNLRVMRRPMRR
jgi:CubicO group peptidase (beta-lactamase class C family)